MVEIEVSRYNELLNAERILLDLVLTELKKLSVLNSRTYNTDVIKSNRILNACIDTDTYPAKMKIAGIVLNDI